MRSLPFPLSLKSIALFRVFLMAAIVCLALVPEASGQFYFGKNKVQYTSFDWRVMETEHFRVYFYAEAEEIAKIGAGLAEESYRELAALFTHEVSRKIPFIIYSSPSYFSQTNVIPGLLPESVGGFTEFMKGRVVVPFFGSYYDFAHVIRHEMVHVFQIDRLDEARKRHGRLRWAYPPLWFTEGLAEFWSKRWDTQADMIIKDMILNNRFFPVERLYQVRGTYFMYKLGESMCQFIDSAYGPDKLAQIYNNWHKGRSFAEIIEVTLGDDLREVSRKWEYSLKKTYYPEMADLGLPDQESEQVTLDGYSLKGVPIRWDDGSGERDWVVFKANKLGYSGIYIKPARKGDDEIRALVKGERSSDFESLYLLRSGIDANDSGLVVFSSKSKERDVVYLYDLNRDEIVRRYEFPELVTAKSPRLSPDGQRVVFSGATMSGFTNLYLLDLTSGDYRKLTDDLFYDTDPTFSADGLEIVFTSDRGPEGFRGALNLFRLDIETGAVAQVTYGFQRDTSPECTGKGIFFSSNRGGSFNLFLLKPDGTLERQTTFATGAFDPRLSSDGTYLVYTGYQNLRYQVFRQELPEPEEAEPFENEETAFAGHWLPKRIDGKFSQASIRYDTDYSLDIAQSMIGYDPVYGSIGGLMVAVSDMLGNRGYYLLLTNTAGDKEEFFESFNVGLTYINRERRLNWGLGGYHLYDEYYNDFDQYYYERQAGAISLFSYPISKFHRIDFTTLARYSKREKAFGLLIREAFLVSNYLSWVYDNSLWDISGPIEGRRYNLTVGVTTDVDRRRNFNRTVSADIRHYLRLGRYSAFANRLFGYHSSGVEPQRIYLGGSWSFRGYDRRAFYNRNVLFASNELRFPLIDQLFIGSPIAALGFSAIRGALFFDVGSAWDDEFDQFLGSYGGGFRVALGYVMLLRFDFSRTTDFYSTDPHTHFDFFFGWNF